jgi:hypothetical protein
MSINVTFFITNPSNFRLAMELGKQFSQVYNIKPFMITNKANEAYRPQEFQVVDTIYQILNYLLMNRLGVILSDETLDFGNNTSVCVVQIWPETNELFFNGKRFKIATQLEEFIVQLVKLRSKSPLGLDFGNQSFLITNEGESGGFSISDSMYMPYLFDMAPNIRLFWNFGDAETLRAKWLHLTEKMKIKVIKDTNIPTVVINSTNVPILPNSVIYFAMEPFGERQYAPFLKQIENKALFIGTHERHLNNAEWHLSPSLAQLKQHKPVKKFDAVLSVVVSDKAWDPGHKYRLSLISAIDKRDDLPFKIDIYGRCASLNFRNYKGELPDQSKDDAIFPYKYHLNVENHYIKNYITEKLYDSICGECLTFYKGASNWKTFFHPESVMELEGDIEKDIELITKAITTGEYEKRVEFIRKDKERILTEYSFEPRVCGILSLVGTVCYSIDNSVSDHLRKEGFKEVQTVPFPIQLGDVCQRGYHANKPMYMQLSSNIYENLFDKLCFALAKDPTFDCYIIEKDEQQKAEGKLDVLIMPSGCEKMIKNIVAQKSVFDGLKFFIVDYKSL